MKYWKTPPIPAKLPAMAEHALGDNPSGVTFNFCVEKIIEPLERQPRPVILVVHASVGFLLRSTAPKLSDNVEGLVFGTYFALYHPHLLRPFNNSLA